MDYPSTLVGTLNYRKLPGRIVKILVSDDFDWRDLIVIVLIILITMILVGSLFNGFFVVSLTAARCMDTIGYRYFLAAGFTDLTVTLLVLPIFTSYIAITDPLVRFCKLLHLFAQLTVYSRSYISLLTALGWSMHGKKKIKEILAVVPVKTCLSLVVFFSTCVVMIGMYTDMEFDFCCRESYGNFYYRIVTNMLMFVLPSLLAVFISYETYSKIGSDINVTWIRREYRKRYFPIEKITLIDHVLFVTCWAPYFFTIYFFPDINNIVYTLVVLFGLSRSVFVQAIFASNKYFRKVLYHCSFHVSCFQFECCASPSSSRGPSPEVSELSAFDLRRQYMDSVSPMSSPSVMTV